MDQLGIVLYKVLETFDDVLVELGQWNLSNTLLYLFNSQLFLLLEKRVEGKREMGQSAIALDNFEKP